MVVTIPIRQKETKINMDGLWYTFTDELTPDEEEFFAMVERCDLTAVEQFLILNRIKNVNMKNYQGITPLHLAVQNDCEPLVDLFLRQKGKSVWLDDSDRIGNYKIVELNRTFKNSLSK